MIPVVFSTDDNYAAYCGVAISSLIENVSPEKQYIVYILYSSLTETNLVRFHALGARNVTVACVDVGEKMKAMRIKNTLHLTVASSYSLLIADMFPDYEKVIYLDSDIIVTDDVSRLLDFDLGQSVMGVVRGFLCAYARNNFHGYVTNKLNVSSETFFNAGILVINTKRFSEEKIADACFALLTSRRKFLYMDQDVLNIVCADKVSYLPPLWNYEWTYQLSETVDGDEQRTSMRHFDGIPSIIHYSSGDKPWEHPAYPLAQYFWQYARRSVFYEEIVYKNAFACFKEYLFPYGAVARDSKVILYGAGKVGKQYFQQVDRIGYCTLVKWCDRKYADIRYPLGVLSAPEEIFHTDYEWIVIAVESKRVSAKIRKWLIENGAPENKIVWDVRESKRSR